MNIFSFLKKKPKIIVILGQTATGKTSLSVEIAKRYNGEIISADSRQVYRGLDIGSAKITQEEMRGISHHMIDVVDPSQQYTVQEYVTDATIAIKKILQKNKVPIICGGTGMYIDALVNGTIFPSVPPNSNLRQKLNQKNTEELSEYLKQLDKNLFQKIDRHNKVRLIRAIEIIETLGYYPEQRKEKKKYKVLFIGLKLSQEELYQNIDKRIYERLEHDALIEEVQKLHMSGLTYERLYEFGLEYRYVSQYLQNELSYDEMIQKLSQGTKNFAKRQMTWFKRNDNIYWFHPLNNKKEILNLVKTFLT